MRNHLQSEKEGYRSLILVKPSGYKRPFFYICGADGHTIDSILGQYLDPERPFYGIRALGRDGKGTPHTCIEEMAAYYVQEIQTVQAEGPYLLGGRCTGGNIALEIAQQLEKNGQKALLVAMVDSPKPLLTEEEKVRYWNSIDRERMRWSGKLTDDGSDLSLIKTDFNPEVFKNNLQIPVNYIPLTYSGRVAYFAAQEKSKDPFISELLQPNAWNRWIINGVEVHEVPGDHLSMTKEPNAVVLAKELSNCLNRAEYEEQEQGGSREKLSSKHSINQQLEEKGYKVIDFFSGDEVLGLLKLYKEKLVPKDLIEPVVSATICSSDLSYRQQVTQELKRIFISKLEVWFPKHKVALCTFISKKSNESYGAVDLHQDRSFADEANLKTFGVWCPLIDVNEQNGCFHIVQKSHWLNSTPRSSNGFPYSQEILSLMKQNYLTSVPMRAGQALVYDNRLFHGSFPNLANAERVAVICVLTPKDSPVLLYYRDPQVPSKLEVFKVDDAFYDSYIQGSKPKNAANLGTFDYQVDPITPEQLVRFMDTSEIEVNRDAGIRERFLSFFNLLRGSDWWFYKIPPLLAVAYAEILLQSPPPQTALATLLALLASMFFVAAYGHVINDIFDVEVDLQAGKHNQISALSNLQRILLCILLAGLGFLPWLFIGFTTQSAILLAVIYTLLTIYSAPPLRLKERDVWGVITDAAQVHAVPTLLVATVFSHLTATPQPQSAILATVATGWAFLAGIRGILLHQIWDRDSDLSAGVTTLVTKIGAESTKFGIRYLTFPVELLLLGLLVLAIAQFAPSLLIFCALYILVRTLSTKSGATELEPAPAQKTYIVPHDFYEVWLPLALLILLAIREPLFLTVLVVHIGLFYPAVVQRLTEINLLLLSGSKSMADLVKLMRNHPDKQGNISQQGQEMLETSINLAKDELKDSITQGIDFLIQAQLNDGEFQTTLPDENLKAICETLGLDQQVTEKFVFDSSPFVTSLIVYSLSFLSHEDRVQSLISKGLDFLLQEIEPGSLWRYWSSKNAKYQAAPPDLDDICCASYVLRMNGISTQSNTAIILNNRDQEGLFYTWLLPRSFRGFVLNLLTFGKRFSHLNGFWKLTTRDDICCVVNANVLLYFGENRQTQKVIKYLTSIVLQGTEDDNTSFYDHMLSFYYMLSRAYFNGANSLRAIKILAINKILSLQEADGSFGDELLTALAVCTLLNFNCQAPSLDKAVNFLLKTQQPNGSWQRIPMYGGKTDKKTFGSAELTTAFCLEAFARYRLLNRVENWQQSRVEVEQIRTQLQQSEQEITQLEFHLQQAQRDSERLESQLKQTKQDLAQFQSEHHLSKAELIQLKAYLHRTQGTLGVIDFYRHQIATNPDDLQLYYQALETSPDDAQFHRQLGNALVRQNKISEAIATYQAALQFHPDDFEIHFELAKTLEKAKRWDEAIAAYQSAISLNPNHALAHQHLGDTLADRGQLHEASLSYRHALQLQREFSESSI